VVTNPNEHGLILGISKSMLNHKELTRSYLVKKLPRYSFDSIDSIGL